MSSTVVLVALKSRRKYSRVGGCGVGEEDAIKLAFDAEMSGGGRTSMYHPCTEAMDSVKRRRSNGVIFRNYIGGKVRSGKNGEVEAQK